MEIIIVFILIIINGVFAMAEIAIVSSRRSHLQKLARDGNKSAQSAVKLSEDPNIFLSTVQIGITLVGIFAGAFGGVTIARPLAELFSENPVLSPYANILSVTLVVVLITYLSLIIGELVPKRLALASPEKIALYLARPMSALATITSPIVKILSLSTNFILRILQVDIKEETPVSEEEVRMLIREGTRVGIFEMAEKDIVERTLKLGDKKINAIMTPRSEIVWLKEGSTLKTLRHQITTHPHAYYPVCKDSLDNVLGVVRTEDLLTDYLKDGKFDLTETIRDPQFVPEGMLALKLLEIFKQSGIHMSLVVDEYGNVQGIVSINDILEALVGDIPAVDELQEKNFMKREDGSWLVDGLVTVDEFKDHFSVKKLPGENPHNYQTLGGFVVHMLGKIPVSGDGFEWNEFFFEVVDMDQNRVDKILIRQIPRTE